MYEIEILKSILMFLIVEVEYNYFFNLSFKFH